MLVLLKALLSTTFMTIVSAIFFGGITAVIIWQFHAPMFAYLIGEGFAMTLTAVAAVAFFLRAWRFERSVDAASHADA